MVLQFKTAVKATKWGSGYETEASEGQSVDCECTVRETTHPSGSQYTFSKQIQEGAQGLEEKRKVAFKP